MHLKLGANVLQRSEESSKRDG